MLVFMSVAFFDSCNISHFNGPERTGKPMCLPKMSILVVAVIKTRMSHPKYPGSTSSINSKFTPKRQKDKKPILAFCLFGVNYLLALNLESEYRTSFIPKSQLIN